MPRLKPIVLLLIAAGGLLTLAAGCVPRSTRPDILVVRETRNESIADVLKYADNVLSLAPAAQTAARNSLARQFQLTQFPEDRMRLALLDTLLPTPGRDDSEAGALLSGYNWPVEGPGFQGLAGVLMQILNERNTQAKKHADLSQQRARIEQQLATERAEKNHLQQQLEALERIEKTVNTRTNPTPPAAGTHPAVSPAAATHWPAPTAAASTGG